MSESRRSLVAYLAAMVGCGVILVLLLQLWRADFRVPFAYGGDAVCTQIWVKGLAEHGWFLENPSLGARAGWRCRTSRWPTASSSPCSAASPSSWATTSSR